MTSATFVKIKLVPKCFCVQNPGRKDRAAWRLFGNTFCKNPWVVPCVALKFFQFFLSQRCRSGEVRAIGEMKKMEPSVRHSAAKLDSDGPCN